MAAPIKAGSSAGKANTNILAKVHGSQTAAADRAKNDRAERLAAANILRPKEVQGEWDASRTLFTTLGGKARAITAEDLRVFRDNVRRVQKSHSKGIRARQVLDLSLKADMDKARKEIRTAVPVHGKNGVVRFMTNASAKSKHQHHYVHVSFLSFEAAASGGRSSPKQMAGWLRKEPLKYDCTCERHRYWFRYISTIGGFNQGRAETGFPKIRNPHLNGIACKHVVRVMAEIESSVGVQIFLANMIAKGRESDDAIAKHQLTQKEAEALAQKQSKRPRVIKTSSDREAARIKNALSQAIKAAPLPKRAARGSKAIALTKDQKQAANMLAQVFGLSPKELLALLPKTKG